MSFPKSNFHAFVDKENKAEIECICWISHREKVEYLSVRDNSKFHIEPCYPDFTSSLCPIFRTVANNKISHQFI